MRERQNNTSRFYRIGELASLTGLSARTIDYYTSIGLLHPAKRSNGNFRLYDDDTLERIYRIEEMKAQKYTLGEIKTQLASLNRATTNATVSRKLAELQTHMTQLEREVKELEPVLEQLKPQQAKRLYRALTPSTAACIDALLLLLGKNNFM
ncbi:MAG: MerR family transcriptional regulator [Candidatus Cohnella colombiensis]|uniref:MerR family transcriptional regulator n=1 Tax=Candidatus Cohnella colombiensis TaxID=3121368 RepID=A0AA95EYV6_9BACL|nr:MAG: MerR family transcriptional regulator [Cohnella sp.]